MSNMIYSKIECCACDKEAFFTTNVRHSNADIKQYFTCKYHFNLAQSKLMVFLKHVRKKRRLTNTP